MLISSAVKALLVLTFVLLATPALWAGDNDVVTVSLSPTLVRNTGGVSVFDRNQFVTIHEGPDASDISREEMAVLREQLDVRFGRNGGQISAVAAKTPADAQDKDMPSVADIQKAGRKARKKVLTKNIPANDLREVVLCAHPELMHAVAGNDHAPWGPRTNEGVAEFTAQFLKHYFSDDNRPRFVEVFNEPFIKAKKAGSTIEAMSEQHNFVAKRIRALCPDVKVGGYSAAWIEVDGRNFGHWQRLQQKFMDIAGKEMDFFSYHVYDGTTKDGKRRVRTGSNTEAIMDLITTYSDISFGVAKPILITEFGRIPVGGMVPSAYSPKRSAGMLYSLVGQLMTYMDHPDCLAKVVPFILGRGSWTYSFKGEAQPGEATPFLLWRKKADGTFVETDLMKFYQFCKGIKGQWRSSQSSNPDVRVHLLADENRMTLILMNLDTSTSHPVALEGLDNVTVKSVRLRSLFTNGDAPVLDEREIEKVPTDIRLEPGSAVAFFIETDAPIEPAGTISVKRIYATECLKDIQAEKPMVFEFHDVPTGVGNAFIRLSSGRPHDVQILPSQVRLNGTSLTIPDNWAGGTQAGRDNFFGMIEIPVPMELVQPESKVEVTYPDTGGKTASVVLQLDLRSNN